MKMTKTAIKVEAGITVINALRVFLSVWGRYLNQ